MRPMDISRARVATAAGFLTQGLILLSLTTRLPDFQDKWASSDVTLSLILLMMILLAGVGSVVAETLAKRRDSALLLRSGLILIAIAVPRALPGADHSPSTSSASPATASGSASSTPAPTCRPSPSSTATAGRSCRRSTAPGPSAA